MSEKQNRDLDEWLEAVGVDQLDMDRRRAEGLDTDLTDWWGVSIDDEGGYVAYFRDEEMAFNFRLNYINAQLNSLKVHKSQLP